MDSLHTPVVEGLFHIMPDDIDATRQFFSAFGYAETENAALGVVLFCQAKGEWAPFTPEELTAFFHAAKETGTVFPFTHLWTGVLPGGGGLNEAEGAATLFLSAVDKTFRFNDLFPAIGSLVRLGEDGKYRVTEMFIETCHQSSPRRGAEEAAS